MNLNIFIQDYLCHICDILAIPLFALLTIYFYNKKNKSVVEMILFLFGITGLVLDSLFTFVFFKIKPFA
jgi:hypothetical protein